MSFFKKEEHIKFKIGKYEFDLNKTMLRDVLKGETDERGKEEIRISQLLHNICGKLKKDWDS